jgi:hypothetical protein
MSKNIINRINIFLRCFQLPGDNVGFDSGLRMKYFILGAILGLLPGAVVGFILGDMIVWPLAGSAVGMVFSVLYVSKMEDSSPRV